MAFVLKEPHGASKGILVFTHKELDILTLKSSSFDRLFERIRDRYVIAMHWGHFTAGVVSPDRVDVHLAAPGTVEFDGPARRIPLSSRNFIPAAFADVGAQKIWDIVTIARPLRLKRLDDLLEIVRRLYDRGEEISVLAICPRPERMSEPDWHTTLWSDYLERFDELERSRFVLLILGPDGYPFPLAEAAVAHAYNRSRAFVLLSEQEGESRSVAEALLCGLHVIARSDVRGGAADYLDASNSLRYESLTEAVDAFSAVARGDVPAFSPQALRAELSESESASRLTLEFSRLFDELGVPFDGPLDLIGLARKLPGHGRLLGPEYVQEFTDDLRSGPAAVAFLSLLLGTRSGGAQRLGPRVEDRRRKLTSFACSRLSRLRRRLFHG